MQRGYHAATTFIDAQIGKLLTALDTLSLRQSTIVAVIGDRAPVTPCLPPC
jgi:arylsulfatase A-like enzyme